MTPARRFLLEYRKLAGVLPALALLRLVGATVLHARQVLGSRTMTAIDRAMSGEYRICYRGKPVELPLAAIDGLLEAVADNPTFGNLREMFANDVYLRAFPWLLEAETVVDLGSNRGLFLVIAKAVLGARLAVGIEPQPYYQPVFKLLCERNAIGLAGVAHLGARIAPASGPGALTMAEVIERFGLDRIDFLKGDIEGDEYPLFSEAGDWLSSVRTLAFELHPWLGDNRVVVDQLVRRGFLCLTTDQFGRPAAVGDAAFVYASTVGPLHSVF